MKFIDEKDLGQEILKSKNLQVEDISWATTSKFSSFAKNHCGAVAITNLVLYFSSKGYKNLFNSLDNVFLGIYKFIGNGPRIRLTGDIRRYFLSKGYRPRIRILKNYKEIKESIDKDSPALLLLADKLFSWHWVLGVGYFENGKDKYIRVVDGWNNTSKNYYKFNKKIKFLYGLRVYI